MSPGPRQQSDGAVTPEEGTGHARLGHTQICTPGASHAQLEPLRCTGTRAPSVSGIIAKMRMVRADCRAQSLTDMRARWSCKHCVRTPFSHEFRPRERLTGRRAAARNKAGRPWLYVWRQLDRSTTGGGASCATPTPSTRRCQIGRARRLRSWTARLGVSGPGARSCPRGRRSDRPAGLLSNQALLTTLRHLRAAGAWSGIVLSADGCFSNAPSRCT